MVKSENTEKVLKANVVREKGWLYYLDKNCNIARSPMIRHRGDDRRLAERKPQIVCKTNIVREEGWLYFIDKDGDVSRTMTAERIKMEREFAKGPPAKPKRFVKKRTIDLYTDYTGQTLLNCLNSIKDVPLSEVRFNSPDGSWLSWENPESEECYEKRISKWKAKLAEYKEWEKKNHKKIIKSKRDKLKAEHKNLINEIERLNKARDEIENQIKNLK